jgi:hypothetical protein
MFRLTVEHETGGNRHFTGLPWVGLPHSPYEAR